MGTGVERGKQGQIVLDLRRCAIRYNPAFRYERQAELQRAAWVPTKPVSLSFVLYPKTKLYQKPVSK